MLDCHLVVGGGVRLVLPTLRTLPGGQLVWGSQRSVGPGPAAAGGEVSPERRRVEAVDDGIAAGVQIPKNKESVVDIVRRDVQHVGLEPVPDAQQVVGSPAHHEGQHDDHRHLQGLHPSFRDDVSAAASQV